MKNLIIAALLGNLSMIDAVQLQNVKQTIKLQRLNILAQTNGDEGDELGIPGLGAAALKAPAGGAEDAIVAAAEGKEGAKLAPAVAGAKEAAVDATNEKSKKPEEEAKPSPAEPNSAESRPEGKRDAVTDEVKAGIKADKDASEAAENTDKKVADAKTDKTPGQAAAAAEIDADKKKEEMILNFPTVTECGPYKVEIENGLRRLDGIRGKSTHQELLGRCQEKWLAEKANGDKPFKRPEANLAKLAEDKAEVERLAEQSEWHNDNWNMGKNQHEDEVQAIITSKKAASILAQQKIESFIIFPTDTPAEMDVKKANIEKRNIDQLAQAKAEFDAELNEASELKKTRDAQKIISDKIQADAEKKDAADQAAHLKKIEDAEVVESQQGLDIQEVLNARKQLNDERIQKLDKERFEYAKKIRDESQENYDKVHAEFKSVAEQMAYAKERRLNWSKESIKTTNDELWAENMPLYIQSETNPEAKALLEKEYRMAQESGKKADPKDGTKEEKDSDAKEADDKKEEGEKKEDDAKKEAKVAAKDAEVKKAANKDGKSAKEDKKEEKKENKTEEAKEEKKPEKKEEKKPLSAKDEKVANVAAGVQADNQSAAKAAGETDDEMYYANFKAEMQNKKDQRVADIKVFVAPTLENLNTQAR